MAALRATVRDAREAYPNMAMAARDMIYDSDPLSTFDIFSPKPAL